jgi:hypothetical protein
MSDYYRIVKNGFGGHTNFEIVRLSKRSDNDYFKILSVARTDTFNKAIREVQKRTVFSENWYVDYQNGHHFIEINIKDEAELVQLILENT